MPDFDPYRDWLDIDPAEQPADHYRLLGLARFETDRAKIERAADERMAHIRQVQTGPRGAYTQKLLNELSAARVCLLDPLQKAHYDAELAARLSARAAARRAAVQPPPAPIVPPAPPVSLPNSNASRTGSAHQNNWQITLLISAGALALLMAAGGWLLGRYRTTAEQPSDSPKTSNTDTPEPVPAAIQPAADGTITFDTTAWDSPITEAAWPFHLYSPGFFHAEVTYATAESFTKGDLVLQIDDRSRTMSLRGTRGIENFQMDTVTVAVPRSGRHTLMARALVTDGAAGLKIRAIRLVPVELKGNP